VHQAERDATADRRRSMSQSLGASRLAASRPKCRPNCPLVDPEVIAELRRGPSLPVELNGRIDLLLAQSLSAHGDACPAEVPGHGQAMDPEAISELIDGGASLIAANESIDFVVP
jgi:hypothetical protein